MYIQSKKRNQWPSFQFQPNEWDIAAFLPLQQFRGAKAQEVWQESLEQIRN